MKKILFVFVCLMSFIMHAQDNVFLNRAFWKTQPNVDLVKQKIAQGNDPAQLNPHAMDAVTYAILEKAPYKTIQFLLDQNGNGINKLTHDKRTYIFWAAYKDNLPLMQYLTDKGATYNIKDSHQFSPLTFAAAAGVLNTEVYDLCIKNGNDVKEKNQNGSNALLLVLAHAKNYDLVDYFTQKGLNINDVDNDGNGAVSYAAYGGNKEMIDQLIKKGLPYKEKNTKGGNAFLQATRGKRSGYNSLEFFKYLEGLGISPNITNNEGTTPLHHLAYRNEDVASLQYFIDKGVNPNTVDDKGNTPLINSGGRNSLEVIKLLANNTKNINHTNKKGHSVVTKSLRNSPEVLQFLLNKNADVSVIDKSGNNLTYYLINSYNPKKKEEFTTKLEALIKSGLAFSKPQKDGSNAYHLAIEKNDVSLLNMLKNFKLDINKKDNNGITPLHKAIMTAKSDKIVKHLLANGADKTIKTDLDETVYELAAENEVLKQKNIDISFLK